MILFTLSAFPIHIDFLLLDVKLPYKNTNVVPIFLIKLVQFKMEFNFCFGLLD